MDLLNKMKLYDLGIITNSDDLMNGSYGIIIEDFSPTYYIIENWTFEKGEEVDIKSIPIKKLRAVTNQEEEKYQVKFQKYIEENK